MGHRRVQPLLPPASTTSSYPMHATSFPVLAVSAAPDDVAGHVQSLLTSASATSSYPMHDTSVPVLAVSATPSDGASVTKLWAKHVRRKAAGAMSSSAAEDEEYRKRREKNNRACQLSRDKRKKRETDMEEELRCLKEENARLQKRVTQLETQLERFKQKIKSAFVHALRRAPYDISHNEL